MENQVITVGTTHNNTKSRLIITACFLCAVAAIGISAYQYLNYQTLRSELVGTKTDLLQKYDTINKKNTELEQKVANYEAGTGFSVNDSVDKDGYQAVFLTDESVYFGKLSDGLPGQVKLTNIYYLNNGTYEQGGSGGNISDLSLVKLGSELHSPKDEMNISRDQMKFWENLKNDGQIVRAIQDYEKQNPKSN